MRIKATELLALQRYWNWADHMYKHYREREASYTDERKAHWEPYLAYWLGGLFVVCEGWRRLALTDDIVDKLLKDKAKLGLLELYRHGAFHYQRDYFDRRFLNVWDDAKFWLWVRRLHRALGRAVKDDVKHLPRRTSSP